MALTLRQSQPPGRAGDLDQALDRAGKDLAAYPDLVPAQWVCCAVCARRVEFWRGDQERRHQRLRYEADPEHPGDWTSELRWP